LEASYEATICAGILNGNDRVCLTLVAGGAFGTIKRAVLKYLDYP